MNAFPVLLVAGLLGLSVSAPASAQDRKDALPKAAKTPTVFQSKGLKLTLQNSLWYVATSTRAVECVRKYRPSGNENILLSYTAEECVNEGWTWNNLSRASYTQYLRDRKTHQMVVSWTDKPSADRLKALATQADGDKKYIRPALGAIRKLEGAAEACSQGQLAALEKALESDSASLALREILKVREVSVEFEDNVNKALPDDGLSYGLSIQKNHFYVKAVLNSAGECKSVSADEIRAKLEEITGGANKITVATANSILQRISGAGPAAESGAKAHSGSAKQESDSLEEPSWERTYVPSAAPAQ